MTNTLIAGNSASGSNAKDFKQLGQVTSASNNLVKDATGHSLVNGVNGNIVGIDPLLGPLANNGGPTFTHTLLAGSAAIDAGTATGAPTTDQRGLPRPSGLGVDIGSVEVVASVATALAVSKIGSSTIVAGEGFNVTAQVIDQSGNPVTNYGGPYAATAAVSPPDPQGTFPATGTLSPFGFGFFLGTLKTAGTYTITASAGSYSGSTSALTVVPASASYFIISAQAAATTGKAINVTVKAYDRFGNLATGYAGTVKLTSTDPVAATLVSGYTFTTGAGKDNGLHVFSVTLNSAGNQTITAQDIAATNPVIVGASSTITMHGLTVASVFQFANGFTVSFSKPIDPSKLTLYGPGNTAQDMTIVGAQSGVSLSGTFVFATDNSAVAFKLSAAPLNFLNTVVNGGAESVVFPDDTYTVTLKSGTAGTGFYDLLGDGLDGGNNGGHADYITTFTTHYQASATPVLAIPDFARGPDGSSAIKVPNNSAGGIPITLYNAVNVTDVAFTLTFTSGLFAVTGASTTDSSRAGSSFTLTSSTATTAKFSYHNSTPQSGKIVLGDVLANVPGSAKTSYKLKNPLQFSTITVNGVTFTGTSATGIHVNAYAGDVSGDGLIGAPDVNPMFNVAIGAATGFAPYSLLDPAIIGDVAGDVSVDGGDVATLKSYILHFPRPVVPTPPGLTGILSPNAADPVLSLAVNPFTSSPPCTRETGVNVAVLLDEPHPEGSTGLTEAVLALRYDPTAVSVSVADITLGSLTSGGAWRLSAVVDQLRGEIGIELWSDAPITANTAGSLVNVVVHPIAGATTNTAVEMVDKVAPGGELFTMLLADGFGALIVSTGVDRVLFSL